MTLYYDRPVIEMPTLEEVLPTPVTFFQQSNGIELIASVISLALIWVILIGNTESKNSPSKTEKYYGLALAYSILFTSNLIAQHFKWQLSNYFGKLLMSKLPPLLQHTSSWWTYIEMANACYVIMLIYSVYLIWTKRGLLGLGVLKIQNIVQSLHNKV